MKRIVAVYNSGQKKYEIDHFDNKSIVGDIVFITFEDKGDECYTAIGIYEFFNNPKYDVIPIMMKDKETRQDFARYMAKNNDCDKYDSFGSFWHEYKRGMIYLKWEYSKEMLKGYQENYLIDRLKKETNK